MVELPQEAGSDFLSQGPYVVPDQANIYCNVLLEGRLLPFELKDSRFKGVVCLARGDEDAQEAYEDWEVQLSTDVPTAPVLDVMGLFSHVFTIMGITRDDCITFAAELPPRFRMSMPVPALPNGFATPAPVPDTP